MSQKIIEAIVEIQPFESEPPWAIASVADWSFLRLFSGVTDEEVGSVVLTACSYNRHFEVQCSAIETLNAFVAEDFIMLGGLQFSDNDQVKVVRVVVPGWKIGANGWTCLTERLFGQDTIQVRKLNLLKMKFEFGRIGKLTELISLILVLKKCALCSRRSSQT